MSGRPRRQRWPRLALCCALLLDAAVVAAPAQAGTLTLKEFGGYPEDPPDSVQYSARYTAAPGEINRVTLNRSEDTWTLTDGGAAGPIAVPAPCTSVTPATVTCPLHPAGAVRLFFTNVTLGDRDDSFKTTYVTETTDPVRVDGGAGDDTMSAVGSVGRVHFIGGAGDDRLTGSDAGAELSGDVLVGGPGDDTLLGGAGSDTLLGDDRTASHPNGSDRLEGGANADFLAGDGPAAPAPDVLSGGPGTDWAEYTSARTAVRVDLGAGTTGGAGAGDKLTSIAWASGGRGDDVLVGDAGPNLLDGGTGHDLLIGRGGDDELSGGAAADRLRGGSGDDKLEGDEGRDRLSGGSGDDVLDASGDHQRDELHCGPGRDAVAEPNAAQRIPQQCEGVRIGAFGLVVAPDVQAAAGGVIVRVLAGPTYPDELKISAVIRGAAVARGSADVAVGERPQVALRPTTGASGLRPPPRALRIDATTLLGAASWLASVR